MVAARDYAAGRRAGNPRGSYGARTFECPCRAGHFVCAASASCRPGRGWSPAGCANPNSLRRRQLASAPVVLVRAWQVELSPQYFVITVVFFEPPPTTA